MQDKVKTPNNRSLGIFAFAMMNIVIICSLRGLPIMAEEGLSLLFYYLFAAIVFLFPVSLISAELATGWPPHGPGGVYVWVDEAFGQRWGVLAIWLQWFQNVIWLPTVLSFIAGTLAYLYSPSLANNKVYMIAVILITFWGGTILNFRGIKTFGIISSASAVLGVILPGILLVGLCLFWFLTGGKSVISFSPHNFLPDLSDINNIVFLAGAFLIFSGMEVSAVHTESLKDPKRNLPKAIFLSAAISFIILTLGSLTIAVIIPQKEISLVAGVLEAFNSILNKLNIGWFAPIIAVLIALGSIGELCAWIIGPCKGLFITAEEGLLPPFFQKLNKNKVPVNILIVQGIITTLLSLVFLLMPTVNSSYWLLSALSILLYLMMYIFLFAAGIRLRYSQPNVSRSYKIPGKNIGMWLVAGMGILGALFAITLSFFPPSQFKTGSLFFYETFLIGGTVIMCIVPLLIYQFRKPEWLKKV